MIGFTVCPLVLPSADFGAPLAPFGKTVRQMNKSLFKKCCFMSALTHQQQGCRFGANKHCQACSWNLARSCTPSKVPHKQPQVWERACEVCIGSAINDRHCRLSGFQQSVTQALRLTNKQTQRDLRTASLHTALILGYAYATNHDVFEIRWLNCQLTSIMSNDI